MSDIRSQLSAKDNAAVDFLLRGWDADALNEEFYLRAADSDIPFIRDYFDYDLNVRNTKVEYLNKKLSRPEGKDILSLSEEAPDFDDYAKISELLNGDDILAREKALDDVMWDKIDNLTIMDVFSIDVILGFIAKLKIVDRWLKLDETTGRELFAKLVKEIKENYTI